MFGTRNFSELRGLTSRLRLAETGRAPRRALFGRGCLGFAASGGFLLLRGGLCPGCGLGGALLWVGLLEKRVQIAHDMAPSHIPVREQCTLTAQDGSKEGRSIG